jgi:hypothetical protein
MLPTLVLHACLSQALAAPEDETEGPAALGLRFAANWQLPPADGLYERWDPARSWASAHVIATLQTVAERMALELPLADPLMIGDISRRGGGRMEGHSTHQIGIDVDIGLFMDDGRQPLGGFIKPGQRLDVYATWILIRCLLDTGQVQHILLDQTLIDRLREYALYEVGLDKSQVSYIFPPPSRRLTWSLRGVIRHALNHEDHLHVRLVPPSEVPEVEPGFAGSRFYPFLAPEQPNLY